MHIFTVVLFTDIWHSCYIKPLRQRHNWYCSCTFQKLICVSCSAVPEKATISGQWRSDKIKAYVNISGFQPSFLPGPPLRSMQWTSTSLVTLETQETSWKKMERNGKLPSEVLRLPDWKLLLCIMYKINLWITDVKDYCTIRCSWMAAEKYKRFHLKMHKR